MQLNKGKIEYILKKYRKSFEEMEHYDRTREKLWGRKRVYITLNQRILNKLKKLKHASGKPMSRIIEEAVAHLKDSN